MPIPALAPVAALALARLTFAELPPSATKTAAPLTGSAALADVPAIGGTSSDAAIAHTAGPGTVPGAGKIQNGVSVMPASDRRGAKSHPGHTAGAAGAFTQSAGNILHAGVTIKHAPQGNSIIKAGQVTAEYWPQSGDGGAPVTHTAPGGVTKPPCIHAASVSTSRDVPTGAAVFRGTPAYTGSSNTSFSAFSSWENIQRELRIPSQPQPGLPSQSR